MGDGYKKWTYCGDEHGLDFDIAPEGDVSDIPTSLKPTDAMRERFRRNCEELGLLERVTVH